MKGRGKQNAQNNTQYISSTYRVESDQKDIIIKTLKGDHEGLKKNHTEYNKLHQHYKQLQNKYKLLTDQKASDDRDFKMKHEAALRNIGQIKNQIDSLRSELREKKLQIGDLESDSSSLHQLLDEKNIELQNYKIDFKGCIADSQELGAERESLSNAANKLKGVIGQLQEEDRLLKQDNDNVNKRLDELEKYQNQLLAQQKILRDKIQGFENDNNQLDSDIGELQEQLSELQLSIREAQNELTDIQKSTSEIGLLTEKYKTQSQHVQRSIQAEIMKNNNWIKDLKNAEYTSKVRVGQVEQSAKDVEALKEEKESLISVNDKLSEDLQACRTHLQNLGLINWKLVQHLQNFSSEDDSVRDLINRKSRVEACQNRVNEVQKPSTSLSGTKASTQYR